MSYFTSNKFKSEARKIFWITVGWTIIAVFQFLNGYAIIQNLNCNPVGVDAGLYLRASIFTGLLAGVTGGSIMVLLWEEWLRNKNYGWALLYIFLSFSLLFILVSILTGLFVLSNEAGLSIFTPELWVMVQSGFIEPGTLQNYFFWLFTVLGTLIILQVNDKYGPGTFSAFLMGKYFQPRREQRIFMFLDLRSSTTIAEKLGEEMYFNFLKDVFQHATPAIIYNRGEIYQYVGDEIVISWEMDKGLEKANCLRCFFDIQLALRRKAAYYQAKYKTIPEFKAGLHSGYVMAGEVGVVKRDIAYSGDVLNTAARIQSKCNDLGVNILLSKLLLDRLALPPHTFEPKKIGDMLLRGKQEKVVLYTV
ncbi:MAG: adenylate/guanylate cyclase domain-containing protein [Lewinellaceae bacterium]|nr:adenylate/guanylate cyclase domain-containing protein [Lewinellaceae bacterium]